MDVLRENYMLRISGIEDLPEENFQEILQIDSVPEFKVEKPNDSVIFVSFFKVDGDVIVSDHEEDFEVDEETGDGKDGRSYSEWSEDIYEKRMQKAADWLLSRQDDFLRLQKLGLEMEIYIGIWQTENQFSILLPSYFVAACGKLNLSISLSIN